MLGEVALDLLAGPLPRGDSLAVVTEAVHQPGIDQQHSPDRECGPASSYHHRASAVCTEAPTELCPHAGRRGGVGRSR